jgi:hypothetical protein
LDVCELPRAWFTMNLDKSTWCYGSGRAKSKGGPRPYYSPRQSDERKITCGTDLCLRLRFEGSGPEGPKQKELFQEYYI